MACALLLAVAAASAPAAALAASGGGTAAAQGASAAPALPAGPAAPATAASGGAAAPGSASGAAASGASSASASASGAASSAGAADSLAAVQQAYALILKDYAGKVDPQQLVDGALQGLMQALGDPFSQYLAPSASDALATSLDGYGGIGMAIVAGASGDVIDSVDAGGPAYQAGLRSGDLIVSVNGKSTVGEAASQVSAVVRGTPGTDVVLGVESAAASSPVPYKLQRVQIEAPTVFASQPAAGVGEIQITAFSTNTGAEFDAAYAKLKKQPGGLKGLILDLRDNGGGLVGAAQHIAAELAPPGLMFKIVEASGKTIDYRAGAHAAVPPMVVLVDGGTASAAEILAGVLQYTHTALLVGTRTYGKGSVQDLYDLSGGASIKLTIAHDELPNGSSWDHVGLNPDVQAQAAPQPWSQVPDFDAVGSRSLKAGMVGLDVQGLQQRLAFLGYKPGAASGTYGSETVAAVRAFQKAAGLPVTGSVGTADWTALGKAMAAKVQQLQAQPLPDTVLRKGLQVLDGLMAAKK